MGYSLWGTVQERAAAVALEAVRRQLWNTETALAFVAQVDDIERVNWWVNQLQNLADQEDEVRKANAAVADAQATLREAQVELETLEDRCREVEVATGAITTNRTSLFGNERSTLLIDTGMDFEGQPILMVTRD